jgi:multiple sugar transport system ATP-binding protein
VISVRLSGIHKSFQRGAPVLRDINLEVPGGAFVTLVGPSGCGKSTILNLVAGFERPTAGEILLNGEIVNERSPKDRGAAMVFQSYALYPHLDVYRNIAFPLEVAGVKRKEIDTRVREIAARLEIDRFLERKPRDLSGGQRQRVALGRALVRRTRLCLFDEPLSNLDPSLRELMRGEIKRLHEEGDSTYLYVTHDQIEALTMSDQMVVLESGVVQQVAPPREVYERPANMFVAGFIGSPRINLVRPATLGIPEAMLGGRADVVVGLRPEDILVGGGEAPEGAIQGRVYVAEPMGAATWVTLEIAGERVIGHASADFAPRSGAPAWARLSLERVHFFDRRTTKRLAG